jgi:hypothetical protein
MKLLFTLAVLLSTFSAFSQFDTLVLVNGSRKAVILKEVGEKDIKYKLPADSLGPTYLVKKKLVEKLILRGGCIDLKEKGYDNCVKDPTFGVIQGKDFKRFIVSADLLQLIALQDLQLSMECVFLNRKLGLEIFGNTNLLEGDYLMAWPKNLYSIREKHDGYYYKVQYGGGNIKFYPYAHKKATYWLAIGMEKGNGEAYVGRYSKTGGVQSLTSVDYWGYHLNNGFTFRPSKHFVYQVHGDFGICQFENPFGTTKKKDGYFKIGLGFMVGFAL